MDDILKVAIPVTLGLNVTVVALAVAHSPEALQRLAPTFKKAGGVAMQMFAEILAAKLGPISRPGFVGSAVA